MKRRRGVIIRKFQPENVQLLPHIISAIIAVFLGAVTEILFVVLLFVRLSNCIQCRGAFRCHRILFQRR